MTAQRCDFTWLWPEHCAHCLGIKPDFETQAASEVYE